MSEGITIPSELLEPNMAAAIGVWWNDVIAGNHSLESLKKFETRLWALSTLCSISGATHAAIALNNHLVFAGMLIDSKTRSGCRRTFNSNEQNFSNKYKVKLLIGSNKMKWIIKKATLSDNSVVYNVTGRINEGCNAAITIGCADAAHADRLKEEFEKAAFIDIKPPAVPALLSELIKAKELRGQAQEALQWLEELPVKERQQLEKIVKWKAPVSQLARAIDNTRTIHAVISRAQAEISRKDTNNTPNP